MENKEISQKIDRYLWELLPEEEAQDIENSLEIDEATQTEFAYRQMEDGVLRQIRRDALHAQMKAWREEAELEETEVTGEISEIATPVTTTKVVQMQPQMTTQMRAVKTRPMYWAAAAAFAVLVAFGGSFYWANNNYSNDALVAENTAASANILRGDNSGGIVSGSGSGQTGVSATEILKASNAAFQAKNYEKALEGYEKVLAEADQNGTPIAETDQAEWFSVLSYLALGKTEGVFTTRLEAIIKEPNHTFNAAAVSLQQKLNSTWRRIAK